MLKWVLNWLSAGMLDRLLSYFEKRQDTALEKDKLVTTVTVEEIKAEIETRRLQTELRHIEAGWWVTRWISPFIVYPLAFHLNAVILDSVFNFSWDIAKLPSPIDQWQGTILLSFFLVRPVESFSRSFMDYLRKR